MDGNEALTQIENDLLSKKQFQEWHLFGTFQILFPKGTPEKWEEFKSKPLTDTLSKCLPHMSPMIVFIIYRRHPELTAFFLHFLDQASILKINPRQYIPFLSFRIQYIPIQWIAFHATRIADLRFANNFVSQAFSAYLRHSPNCIEMLHRNDQIWRQFLDDIPDTPYEYPSEGWKKMLIYRTAIRELLFFKIEIKLTEYLRLDKNEYVKRMFTTYDNPAKFRNLLKTQIIPFCEANAIDFTTFIVTIICKKDWAVQQKLLFVNEYLQTQTDIRMALESMTVQSEQELGKLQDYAKKKSIDFTPLPINVVPKITPSSSVPLMRSNSIEELPVVARQMAKPARLEMWRRSPSIDLSKVKKFGEDGSIHTIANGEPKDPIEYANKLRSLKNLKEIKPIFELAENFNMVVAYDDYSMMWGKRLLFDKLITQFGHDRFDEICSTLHLSDDEIMDFVCSPIDYIFDANHLLPKLEKHVHESNVYLYFGYLQNYVDRLIQNDPISTILQLYKKGLEISIRYVNGERLLTLANNLSLVNKIIENDDQIIQKEHFLLLLNNPKLVASIYPLTTKIQNKDGFISSFLSEDLYEFIDSITYIDSLSQEAKNEALLEVLPLIDGLKYTLLQFVFCILCKSNPCYQSDLDVLYSLYSSKSHTINFHALKNDPMTILKTEITQENYYEILSLADLFELDTDELLMTLMTSKMNSSNFEDYNPIVNKLREGSHVTQLLKLIPRFTNHDQINFLNAIGRFDIKRTKQTMFDLMRMRLNSFITDEYLNDPIKLITVLYSKIDLHESLGGRLHKFAKTVATRFGYDIFEVQAQIVTQFLTEEEIIEYKPTRITIFEYPPEPQNMQRALFILRKWKVDSAIDWLAKFVENPNNSYFSRSLAIQCWTSVSDGDVPEEVDPAVFYFKGMIEKSSVEPPEEITDEFMYQLVDQGGVAHCKLFIEYVTYYHLENDEYILKALKILESTETLFLLQAMILLFFYNPVHKSPKIFEIFIKVISAPIAEVIFKHENFLPAKTQHIAVIRDIFNAISLSRYPINYLYINNTKCSWGNVAEMLCKVGSPALAAELGSHLVNRKDKNDVLCHLMHGFHFDDAITFGFDKKTIFEYIVNGHIAHATETLIDAHFVLFTSWLLEKGDMDSIKEVERALVNQGRTLEIKRLKERIARWNQSKLQ
ncbi:hypothetical protein TRFO_39442 [Tritrichomonas foetus]|uniref:RZZ complex subunit KNTC1/ROD C-terminal domain-containing protein n=1 Tax=Tritrichomonas foetus TaxID=1144522 RepID=A0A1J4J4Y6_9EUKA|nr:hypothetical protein TRFO_39442 [Tritrichomonas foetus]|eukprot:OHS94378.1 hypothetical protein TRFO_39442 [Tritrichomonas foetus]